METWNLIGYWLDDPRRTESKSSQRIIRKILAILTNLVSFSDWDSVEIIMCRSNTQKTCQRSIIGVRSKDQFLFGCHNGSIVVDIIKFAQSFS